MVTRDSGLAAKRSRNLRRSHKLRTYLDTL